MNRQQKFSRLLLYVITISFAIPLLLPFFWLISSSLKTYNRVYHYPPEWIPIIENFFIESTFQPKPFLVNIIDKNEDTGTGVYRIRILSLTDGTDVLIPSELIETEKRLVETIELDGVSYEIQRMTGNRTSNNIPVILKNMHPQLKVNPNHISTEINIKKTVYLFRQHIAVDITEKHDHTSFIHIIEDSKSVDISLDKLKILNDHSGMIEIFSKPIPVRILGINRKANIAEIQIIPSAEILEIDNTKIYETQETNFFIKDNSHRYPIKWVKRGDPSIVKRLDLPLIHHVLKNQIKSTQVFSYFTNLYGQRVELKLVPDLTSLPNMKRAKIKDPISLNGKLVKVEKKFAPQWRNYVDVLTKEPFHYYLVNTVFIALCSILGQILSCSLVGYAFARIRFPGRDFLFIVLLSTLMLPHQVTMIPQFILYVKLGWLDSFKPLIVPTFLAQTAFFVFLFRQYFLTIPLDLEDAARIDGCSPLYTYWHIILPLSKPVIVSVAVFTFMWTWNDFLYPLLYLNSDEHQTLALALENFKTAFGLRDPHFLMAASTMMIIPSIVIFFLAQKAFIRGVVMTGVKG